MAEGLTAQVAGTVAGLAEVDGCVHGSSTARAADLAEQGVVVLESDLVPGLGGIGRRGIAVENHWTVAVAAAAAGCGTCVVDGI